MLDYEVLATIADERPKFRPWQAGSASPQPRSHRSIYDPGGREQIEVAVYDDGAIGAGAEIEGPAIIDGGDTTIFVPSRASCVRAQLGNLNLTLR